MPLGEIHLITHPPKEKQAVAVDSIADHIKNWQTSLTQSQDIWARDIWNA